MGRICDLLRGCGVMAKSAGMPESEDPETVPSTAAPAGAGLTVVTPTYLPDLPLFEDLHNSFLANFSDDVNHLVVVNDDDVPAFARYRTPRCQVLAVSDVIPQRIRTLPLVNGWVNLRRPIPPIRGWIMQQLVKLALADFVETDLMLLVDSDIVFVRAVDESTFTTDGVVSLYRQPDSVDAGLPRHVIWHQQARDLLGIPRASPPYPDYVTSLMAWDRRLVLSLRERLEAVNGRSWIDLLSPMRHLSEWTLYGVFVEDLYRSQHPNTTAASRCHSYWDPDPLSLTEAERFVEAMPADDVAVMISAKSGTPLDIRRAAISRAGKKA